MYPLANYCWPAVLKSGTTSVAVLKSPKNNKTKKLWIKRSLLKNKTRTSFPFYENSNTYERSTLSSYGVRKDTTMDVKKHRYMTASFKEEIRLVGQILPSTLQKPEIKPKTLTYGSKSLASIRSTALDLTLTLNSASFIYPPKAR